MGGMGGGEEWGGEDGVEGERDDRSSAARLTPPTPPCLINPQLLSNQQVKPCIRGCYCRDPAMLLGISPLSSASLHCHQGLGIIADTRTWWQTGVHRRRSRKSRQSRWSRKMVDLMIAVVGSKIVSWLVGRSQVKSHRWNWV